MSSKLSSMDSELPPMETVHFQVFIIFYLSNNLSKYLSIYLPPIEIVHFQVIFWDYHVLGCIFND